MPSAAVVDALCAHVAWCDHDVVQATLQLACEIASEAHEGFGAGALLTLGRADAVLGLSQPLILDPLAGHVPFATHVADARLRGTARALSRLDGAFVVSEEGIVVAACRYLHAHGDGLDLPMGLGSKHYAGAAVSKRLGIVAIVVSETGAIRVYHRGDLVLDLSPRPGWIEDAPSIEAPEAQPPGDVSARDLDRFR